MPVPPALPLSDALAEANVDVGPAVAGGILEGDQEPTGRRRVVAVIAAAPGVDVDHPVRGDDEVSGVANVVREHGGAEPGGQRDPTVVIRAGFRRRRGRAVFISRSDDEPVASSMPMIRKSMQHTAQPDHGW